MLRQSLFYDTSIQVVKATKAITYQKDIRKNAFIKLKHFVLCCSMFLNHLLNRNMGASVCPPSQQIREF